MTAFVGIFATMISLGSVVAPMLLGSAYDFFGSYSPVLVALGAFLAVYAVFIGKIFRIPLKKN